MRERIAIEGARLSYRQNCESMQRVHISPVIGKCKVASVKPEDVERLASRMLAQGSSPKTVRNVMTFLYSVFELAVKNGWAPSNPVADAARPRRRRQGDADPDLQFLRLPDVDAGPESRGRPSLSVERFAVGAPALVTGRHSRWQEQPCRLAVGGFVRQRAPWRLSAGSISGDCWAALRAQGEAAHEIVEVLRGVGERSRGRGDLLSRRAGLLGGRGDFFG